MSNQSKGRTGGVLPINASATKKTGASQKSTQRSPAPKLRLIIRRLPPGLTEAEFWEALGPDWQTGNGKVDWHAFKEGKISKDPSKPSRPGRAYVKVKDQSLLDTLSAKIRSTAFKDAKNTGTDACLIGPPSLEFAPYNKTPSSRNRHDGRQGTIDQDQEFIDFLQSLTEPIVRAAANGSESVEAKQDKIITTPLVQYIKDKKANKAKEKETAAIAKGAKKSQEGREGKTKGESRPAVVVKSNAGATDKSRVAKATQEAVKAANKTAAQVQTKSTASKPEPKVVKEVPAAAPSTPSPAPTPKPERQRGSASAASKMIARDLGLAPKEPRTPRAARNVSTTTPNTSQNSAKAEPQQKTSTPAPVSAPAPMSATNSKASTVTTAAAAAASTSTPTPPTGPKNNRSASAAQSKPAQPAVQRSTKSTPQPTTGAKSAFLKHANPSQGVTEDLLRTTFSTFGEVTRCEIDKKKGLGYIDFTDTESLKKAMVASPVKIGNGQVVVLENKSPYSKRHGQGGGGTGNTASRAVSAVSSPAPSAVASPQPATAVIATPEAVTTSVSALAATSEALPVTENTGTAAPQPAGAPGTPTAPKGTRSGGGTARGGRGGNAAFAAGRGAANASPNRGRGGSRARGGRGGKAGGNSGAAPAAGATSTAPTQSASQGGATDGAKPAS